MTDHLRNETAADALTARDDELECLCSFDGCCRRVWARGLCNMHYTRMLRRGTLPPLRPRPSELDRFWAFVDVVPACCWTWMGTVDGRGYGKFYGARANGRQTQRAAYRYVWELLVGAIPPGMHLDHLCRNKLRVNPDHLEPVTPRVNTLRGVSSTARAVRFGVCHRGHSDWRIRADGSRSCRACNRERMQRRDAA